MALSTLNAGKEQEERITVRQSKYLNSLIEHRAPEHQTLNAIDAGVQIISMVLDDIGFIRNGGIIAGLHGNFIAMQFHFSQVCQSDIRHSSLSQLI